MENRAHAIIAICFLIVFVTGAVAVFLWLSSAPGEPRAYRIVTSQSVNGLSPQSKVQFKGMEVGHVTRIRFDPDNRAHVIIDFRVRKNTYVTHATYAVLAMQGLTGGEALELKLGKGSQAALKTSDDHPTRIPLHQGLLDRLKASAQQDMADIHAVLGSAKSVLDADNRQHISASLKHIDAATAQLSAIETQLLPVIKQMPALLANANRTILEAQKPIRKAGKLEDTIQSLARSARQLSQKLDKQTVPNVDVLSNNLMRTSRQLDQLLRELKAKPQSLIFGPATRPPGPGEPGFKNVEKGDASHE